MTTNAVIIIGVVAIALAGIVFSLSSAGLGGALGGVATALAGGGALARRYRGRSARK